MYIDKRIRIVSHDNVAVIRYSISDTYVYSTVLMNGDGCRYFSTFNVTGSIDDNYNRDSIFASVSSILKIDDFFGLKTYSAHAQWNITPEITPIIYL